MPLTYVQGDLFNFIRDRKENIVIPHVVNSVGAFGAGFVIPLGRTFPKSRNVYLEWSKNKEKDNPFILGQIKYVQVSDNVIVCHMLAQRGVGGTRPLRYNALSTCMEQVAGLALSTNSVICAPMFGSALAGGDWNYIEDLIEDCWIERAIDVTVYYLPQSIPPNWNPPE